MIIVYETILAIVINQSGIFLCKTSNDENVGKDQLSYLLF